MLYDRGDTTSYAVGENDGHSEADLALVSILLFWAVGDATVTDRLFRGSKLYRSKWDEKHGKQTYGEITIGKATGNASPCYEWGGARTGREIAKRETPNTSLQNAGIVEPPKLEALSVGDVKLLPQTPRRTKTKLIVGLDIRVDGHTVDILKLTDASSSRRDAVKSIAVHAEGVPEATLKEAISTILVRVSRYLAEQPNRAVANSDRIIEIIRPEVEKSVSFTCQTANGRAFDDKTSREMTRATFVGMFTCSKMLAIAEKASDCPVDDNGALNRPALIYVLQTELKVIWGDLTRNLPTDNKDTFRAAIVTIFTKPVSMAIVKQTIRSIAVGTNEESIQLASRTSLVDRIREFLRSEDTLPRTRAKGWTQLQRGYSAWVRVVETEGGEKTTIIAMKWELARQIGQQLPGVHNQASLRKLGEEFRVVDPAPPTDEKITGGKRLCVLSYDVTQEILHDPTTETPSRSMEECGGQQDSENGH